MKHTDAAATLRSIGEALRRAEDPHWSDPEILEWERRQVTYLMPSWAPHIEYPEGVLEFLAHPGPGSGRAPRNRGSWGRRLWSLEGDVSESRTPPMKMTAADYPAPERPQHGPLLLGPEPEIGFVEDAEARLRVHWPESMAGPTGDEDDVPPGPGERLSALVEYLNRTPLDDTRNRVATAEAARRRPAPNGNSIAGVVVDEFDSYLRRALSEHLVSVTTAFDDLVRPAFQEAYERAQESARVSTTWRFTMEVIPDAPIDPRTLEITAASREVLLDWRDARPRPWTAFTAGPQHQPRGRQRRSPNPRALSAARAPRRAGRRP
ncbi:hypothetical protein [Nocardiopsis synnemataformans]|uniref:hypothetical protein n=1 Tax=Nocardiopsis synnemataformans TaxID=61305 RepID=UPI003EB81EB6